MSSSDYRRIARENLQGNWGQSILVAFVAALLGGLITGSAFFSLNIDAEILQELPMAVQRYVALTASIASFLSLVRFIIGGPLQLGYSQYLLNQYSRRDWIENYIGYDIPRADAQTIAVLAETEEVRAMPCYPNAGSIRVIGDVVVVKFGE